MRKIVGLVRYDTDTAVRVHRRDDGQTPPARVEVLYRGQTSGAWFLHTRGAPWNPSTAGEGDSGQQEIEPLTLADAVAWSQVWMTPAKLQTTFGASITEA